MTRIGVVLLALGLTLTRLAVAQAQDASLEYRVKAAYLLNFTRYVTWPPEALPGSVTLEICVLGPDPFGETLDRTLTGQRSQGHPVRARRVATIAEVGGCHLVFVSSAAGGRQAELVRATAGRPILTVGEGEGFLEQGGHVRFVLVQDTVRFEINAAALRRSGLRMSSRLLALAQRVRGA